MSNIKKGAFVFVGQMFNVGLGFVLIFFLSRKLTLESNGTYGQVFFMSEILLSLISIGISSSLYVFYSKSQKDIKNIFQHVILLIIFLGSIGLLIGNLTSKSISNIFNNPNFEPIFNIFCINVVLTFFNNIINLTLIYIDKFKLAILLNILSAVLKFILIYYTVAQSNFVLINIFQSIIIVSTITMLIGFGVCLYYGLLSFKQFRFSEKLIKEIVLVSFPMGITNLLGVSYSYVSGILISSILFQSEYAIYRNGAIELPFIGVISYALTTIYMPQISKLVSEEKLIDIANIKKNLIAQVTSYAYPLIMFFIFFAKKLILLLLSEKYYKSIPIFIVFTMLSFIRITDYQDVLISAKKSKIIMYSNVVFIVSNILLSYIGIKIFGTLGASYGVFFSVFILAAILIYHTAKYLKVSINYLINFSKIGMILIVSSFFCLPSYFVGNNIFFIGGYFCIYITITYFVLIKMNILDVQIVKSLLKKGS